MDYSVTEVRNMSDEELAEVLSRDDVGWFGVEAARAEVVRRNEYRAQMVGPQ